MKRICLAFLLSAIDSGSVQAFCSYGGKDYATTTIAQEFYDARYVAEVEVRSGTAAYADEPDRQFLRKWGLYPSVTLFHLYVVRAYKGHPSPLISFFSERNSGGFYFERPWLRVAPMGQPASFYVGPDLATDRGGRYLLFFNPILTHRGMGTAENHAVFVNYACGQSKPWQQVTARQRRLLARLALTP